MFVESNLKGKMKSTIEKNVDAELLARFAKGEEDAFRELVERYKNGLYAFLRRFLNRQDMVEDVFQETFIQLYSSRESFDLDRPLRPWLFTIAANKAKDALRKEQRKAAIPIGTIVDAEDISFGDMLNVITSDSVEPFESLQREEMAVMVRDVIAKMPANLREIIILAYYNKFSYKQMADTLSIPIGTVKSRLHTAVARFAKDWKTLMREKKL